MRSGTIANFSSVKQGRRINKTKVKSQYLIKHHTMKMYEGVKV
jgi:hypothetical protein